MNFRKLYFVIGLTTIIVSLICFELFFGTTDEKKSGKLYAINVPDYKNGQELTLEQAKQVVFKYRWIYVNASLKDIGEAIGEAKKLSHALNKRPAVLVYLSRFIAAHQRNTYPKDFQQSLAELIKHATKNSKELLVSARSYGVHQSLRVLRHFDNPKIMLTGIAPAFGAFGNVFSDNVNNYINDIKNTKCRYCIIASENDGFTWRAGGAAYKKKIGYRGHNKVGKAMKKNQSNTDIVVIKGADHTPIDEYLKHGLVNAMKVCADRWQFQNTPIGDVIYGRKIK